MNPISKLKPAGILFGVIFMIVGIIFLIVPDRVTELLAIFVGAVITVFGLFGIIFAVAKWNTAINRALILTFGIITCLAGIFMLSNPGVTISIIGSIIGLLAILLAFERFATAYRIKDYINTLPTVISGLIHLIFGIGMIYSAVVVFSIIVILAGIYLLAAGIMFMLSTLFFHDF